MQMRRQADINDVDGGIGQRAAEVGDENGSIFVGKRPPARLVEIADGMDGIELRERGETGAVLRADPGPDDAHAMRHGPRLSAARGSRFPSW